MLKMEWGGGEEETRGTSCPGMYLFVPTTSSLQNSCDSTTADFGGRKKEQSTWQMPLTASEGCSAFAFDGIYLKGVPPPSPLTTSVWRVCRLLHLYWAEPILWLHPTLGEEKVSQFYPRLRRETRWYSQWHQWLPRVWKQQTNKQKTKKQTKNPMSVNKDSQGRQQQHSGWPFSNSLCIRYVVCTLMYIHVCTKIEDRLNIDNSKNRKQSSTIPYPTYSSNEPRKQADRAVCFACSGRLC